MTESITTKIDALLSDFARQVNAEILAGRTKTIAITEHTHTIKVLGETVEMWVYKYPDDGKYRCFSLLSKSGLTARLYFTGTQEFDKPEECFRITGKLGPVTAAKVAKAKQAKIDKLKAELQELEATTNA
jgi:hypothetical protein